MFIQAHEVKVQ